MTTEVPPARDTAAVLRGAAVVPGAGARPVVRPTARPQVPENEAAVDPKESAQRFAEAAGLVAERLTGRSAIASGPAVEVLVTTAALAGDRGLADLVAKRIAAVVTSTSTA